MILQGIDGAGLRDTQGCEERYASRADLAESVAPAAEIGKLPQRQVKAVFVIIGSVPIA